MILLRLIFNMTEVFVPMIADSWTAGHIRIINKARELGSFITLGLLSDKACHQCGESPFQSEQLRIEAARGISKIDNIVLIKDLIDFELIDFEINNIKYILHGDNWNQGELLELRYFCNSISKQNSSKIIEIPYSKDIEEIDNYDYLTSQIITPGIRLRTIRRELYRGNSIRVLEAHNPISAIIAERTTYKNNNKKEFFGAIWSSSLTDSTSRWKPDIESIDLTTRVNNLNEIMEVSSLPIIYDGDTGGKTDHFVYMVRTLERIGVSMVIIEDKTGLKRNSLFGNDVEQKQIEPAEFSEKLKAGKEAQITKDFMIAARIESLILEKGIEDAVKRAEIYINAGADAIMIHSKKDDGKEIFEFMNIMRNSLKTKIPIVLVPTSYCNIKFGELIEGGANIIIYANHMLRAAYPGMVRVAKSILQEGCSSVVEKDMLTIKEILKISGGI